MAVTTMAVTTMGSRDRWFGRQAGAPQSLGETLALIGD